MRLKEFVCPFIRISVLQPFLSVQKSSFHMTNFKNRTCRYLQQYLLLNLTVTLFEHLFYTSFIGSYIVKLLQHQYIKLILVFRMLMVLINKTGHLVNFFGKPFVLKYAIYISIFQSRFFISITKIYTCKQTCANVKFTNNVASVFVLYQTNEQTRLLSQINPSSVHTRIIRLTYN